MTYSIYYYPYIKDDVGSQAHLKILGWLRETFSENDWDLTWGVDERGYKLSMKPENLHLFFKREEDAVAFKLRW